ncbi:Oidioi.mRNA.OKI2018_I69.PAR.g12302.t1.cds [Oikopleura dioica]|uniref:Oidioi.mRNA.OKI2018_I69.PAR.g12302.t1.cds n=1 Tax=Oikopleura dioica TaxID=34765 RepID=A0ABN7RZZ4_OIKDI|nr:Oidioi.mRNA.OKI2018_I69.PAR.g12302.t1.cds [Oikopleura dioica]
MYLTKTLQIKISNARLWKREYFQPYGTNWTKKWLPRHMKGRNAANISSQVQKVNCVIEVVDARLPLSSRNYNFAAQGRAPRLVLFNKEDLANLTPAEKKYFTQQELESAEAVVWGCANETSPSMLPELLEKVVALAAGNLFPVDLIPDGHVQVADYILYVLNQRECWNHYTNFASLSLPSDNINTLLAAICEKYQLYHEPVELLSRAMDQGK